MKRFYRALLCLAATWGMSPAMAGDLYVPEVASGPPPPPVVPPVPYLPPPRWFGPYAGLNLGFDGAISRTCRLIPRGSSPAPRLATIGSTVSSCSAQRAICNCPTRTGPSLPFSFPIRGLVRRVDERATPTVGRCFMQPQDLRMGRLSSSLPV
jgi:hypothetical protein